MQKLSYTVFNRLCETHATSAEISLLLYISRFQTDSGSVVGVYYKSACQAIGITYQTFYVALRGLQDKGLISYVKNSLTDYDITILDNDFSDCNFSDGYINTNHNIFFNSEFHAMKAGAKLMAMDLLKICYSKHGSYIIGTRKFYSNYEILLGVSIRVLREYIHQIKKFFSVGIKEFKYYLTPLKKVGRSREQLSEKKRLCRHYVNALIRRGRYVADSDQINDVADNIMALHESEVRMRYPDSSLQHLYQMVATAITESVIRSNDTSKPERKWKRNINVPFVNKLFQQLLYV